MTILNKQNFYFSKEAKKIRSHKIKNKIRLKEREREKDKIGLRIEFTVQIKDKQINDYYLPPICRIPLYLLPLHLKAISTIQFPVPIQGSL